MSIVQEADDIDSMEGMEYEVYSGEDMLSVTTNGYATIDENALDLDV